MIGNGTGHYNKMKETSRNVTSRTRIEMQEAVCQLCAN